MDEATFRRFHTQETIERNQLIARGWTVGLIEKHLTPSGRVHRRICPYRFCDVYLYSLTAVEQAEATPEIAKKLNANLFKRAADTPEQKAKRKEAAEKAVATKIERMEEECRTAELTIERGWSEDRILKLAIQTHGGNYAGDPGEFNWSPRTARNCIRHNLTNYEQLWQVINRGETAATAYQILRERVDRLIDETYPQYKEGK